MGLFSGKGKLGPGGHRAFAVTSESRASDTVLRFHDCCQSYKVCLQNLFGGSLYVPNFKINLQFVGF